MGKHKRGIARTQTALLPLCVDDFVGADTLPRVIEESGIKPPALIIVGSVVNLHAKLDWFERT